MANLEELKTLLDIIAICVALAESPLVLAVTGIVAIIYLLLKSNYNKGSQG
ncbi:MAG: hypothetical protein F6K36_14500 [Symploca sp. SIO3C6]|nr:hypothetical protein [Symploca sp. SIO3C6]